MRGKQTAWVRCWPRSCPAAGAAKTGAAPPTAANFPLQRGRLAATLAAAPLGFGREALAGGKADRTQSQAGV